MPPASRLEKQNRSGLLRKLRNQGDRVVLGAVGLCLLLALLGYNYYIWRSYWLTSIPLRVKYAFNWATPDELSDLGTICDRLGKQNCSVKVYRRVVKLTPKDTTALGLLAISETESRLYEDAIKHFQIYFALGGGALDALAWHARALKELGRIDEAIRQDYRVLQADPNLLDVTKEMVELLVQGKRYVEALAVIGSFIERVPEYRSYWAGNIANIEEALEGLGSSAQRLQILLKIPAIGEHHFLPIKLSTRASYGFYVVDTGASYLTVSRSVAEESKIMTNVTGERVMLESANGVIEAERAVLSDVSIGTLKLGKVEAVICDSCPLLAGKSLLSRFNIQILGEDGGGVSHPEPTAAMKKVFLRRYTILD